MFLSPIPDLEKEINRQKNYHNYYVMWLTESNLVNGIKLIIFFVNNVSIPSTIHKSPNFFKIRLWIIFKKKNLNQQRHSVVCCVSAVRVGFRTLVSPREEVFRRRRSDSHLKGDHHHFSGTRTYFPTACPPPAGTSDAICRQMFTSRVKKKT